MNNHPYDEPETDELHARYQKDHRWTAGGLLIASILTLGIIFFAGFILERVWS